MKQTFLGYSVLTPPKLEVKVFAKGLTELGLLHQTGVVKIHLADLIFAKNLQFLIRILVSK